METQKGPIVIAGANGRVANHLAKMLLLKGHEVKAIARDISKIRASQQAGATLLEANFYDSIKLSKAFKDAQAVFVYSPLILHSKNLNEDQYTIVKSLIKAIKDAAVNNVVLLSSWGVELTEKSGGILGCRFFEQELEKIKDINTLILRPVWFMENFLYNVDLIKMSGINGLAIKPNVKFPMVTTEDIAKVAFEYLNELHFTGKNILYIKSEKEYNMEEVTQILGTAIGRSGLKYIEFPQAIQKKGMVASGQLSANATDMLIEINQCISKGILKVDGNQNVVTTPTTLELFAKTTFASAFNNGVKPSLPGKLQGLFLKTFLSLAGRQLIKKENISLDKKYS
ncbi:MAG: NmrA family NAD(P)-binding protein [Ferruginibacter sp.]